MFCVGKLLEVQILRQGDSGSDDIKGFSLNEPIVSSKRSLKSFQSCKKSCPLLKKKQENNRWKGYEAGVWAPKTSHKLYQEITISETVLRISLSKAMSAHQDSMGNSLLKLCSSLNGIPSDVMKPPAQHK